MWHWDTPQILENQAYKDPTCIFGKAKTGSAWLCGQNSPNDIALYFQTYARLLLREYGQYVTYWITLNEPLTLLGNGYTSTTHAPARCDDRTKCFDGDEVVEPFVVAHNFLRAHAMAFNAWRSSSTRLATSFAGITLNGDFVLPLTNSEPDVAAAVRDMEFQMAIFMDPIYFGQWPVSVINGAGSALPPLDPIIYGTHTGIYFQNHYTSHYAYNNPNQTSGYMRNANLSTTAFQNGVPIGLPSSNGWLYAYPPGLAANQNWLHQRYPKMAFIVTENGWGNDTTTKEQDVNDLVRCNYYRSYIGNMSANSYVNGINVLGFFAWSIMDNFEWADGFATRFGLTYVDFDSQERTPKLSLSWFKSITSSFPQLPPQGQVTHVLL